MDKPILVKQCACCGILFNTQNNRSIYCGRTCRNRAIREKELEREYNRELQYKRVNEHHNIIKGINKEAQSLGLSYGEYQALKAREEAKRHALA